MSRGSEMSIKKIHADFVLSAFDHMLIALRIGNKSVAEMCESVVFDNVPDIANILASLVKVFGDQDVRIAKALRAHIMRVLTK